MKRRRRCERSATYVRARRLRCSVPPMRHAYVVPATKRFTCVTSLLADMYEDLLPPVMFLAVTCENAPAFFYCDIDGSSLCLQCDMIVHVGGKRTHGRYLLLRQRIEFPGDKPDHIEDLTMQGTDHSGNRKDHNLPALERMTNHKVPDKQTSDAVNVGHGKVHSKLIDLNARPARTHGPNSSTQNRQMDLASDSNHDSPSDAHFQGSAEE